MDQVYISFPKAFWLTPNADGRAVHGFCQWLSPSYAPDSNPRRWNQEMVELASLSPPASHPTILYYIYGEQSQYLTEQVGLLKNEKDRDDYLFQFFQPYYSRLPHYH